MSAKSVPILAALLFLTACHQRRPDNSDPKGVPPVAHEELSWESFFHEPWPDPLHEKYEELFNAPYPNRSPQHFAVARPFSDVQKYDIAFDATAVPGARTEVESGGGKHAVSMQLPESAGKPVEVRTEDHSVVLSVKPKVPVRRYRTYKSEDKVIPLPPDADPDTAKIVRDGDWVRVQFKSKTPPKPVKP